MSSLCLANHGFVLIFTYYLTLDVLLLRYEALGLDHLGFTTKNQADALYVCAYYSATSLEAK